MSSVRRWYERALGAVLVFLGLCCILPLAALWIWSRHEYTVGLSVNLVPHVLPALVIIALATGTIAVLGGITLLRRP